MFMDDWNNAALIEKAHLIDWFLKAEAVVIVGVGNPFRKDDFIGVEIIRNLKNNVPKSVFLIEAETIPEGYIQQIIEFNPSHILIIDAGLIKEQPGVFKIFQSSHISRKTSISTHTLPIRIFCDYLKKTTNAKIALLIIQPEDVTFGEGLTPTLNKTAKTLSNLIKTLLPKN